MIPRACVHWEILQVAAFLETVLVGGLGGETWCGLKGGTDGGDDGGLQVVWDGPPVV